MTKISIFQFSISNWKSVDPKIHALSLPVSQEGDKKVSVPQQGGEM